MLVRGPARRHRRRAPGGEPARRAAARARPPSRGRADLRAPAVGRSSTPPTACSAFAGSLVADLDPGARVRARPPRRDLDVPRPQRPPLPAALALLSPRLAERRLPRSAADRPGPPDPLRPPRRRPQRRRLRPRPRPALRPARGALAGRRSGRIGSSSGRWRCCCRCSALRMAGLDSELVSVLQLLPTLVLLVGDLRAGRDRALRGRPRRQRQRLGGRHRDLARRRARRRPARRTSTSGSCSTAARNARRRACAPSCARTASSSTGRRTFFLALDSVGGGDVRYATSAGWVVSYDMDRRLIELCEAIATADAETDDRYGAAAFASGLGGESMPPRTARVASRWGSPAATPTATRRTATSAADTPDADRPRRPRPRARLRARADPPPRRRPRSRRRPVIEVGRVSDGPTARRAASCSGSRRRRRRALEPDRLRAAGSRPSAASTSATTTRPCGAGRSTTLEDFWASIWDHFEVRASAPYRRPCSPSHEMPGATWFAGVRLNYAENLLAGKPDDAGSRSSTPPSCGELGELSWGELRGRGRRASPPALRGLGVERGDRVVAYLPNSPRRPDRLPRHGVDRRDLVELLARLRRLDRSSTASRRSSRRCSSASTATATTGATSTAATSSPG